MKKRGKGKENARKYEKDKARKGEKQRWICERCHCLVVKAANKER